MSVKPGICTEFEMYKAALGRWNKEDTGTDSLFFTEKNEGLIIHRSISSGELIASAWTNDKGQFLRLEYPKPVLALN